MTYQVRCYLTSKQDGRGNREGNGAMYHYYPAELVSAKRAAMLSADACAATCAQIDYIAVFDDAYPADDDSPILVADWQGNAAVTLRS